MRLSFATEELLQEALVQMELDHLRKYYKSAIHDCPVKGPNPMIVASRNMWRNCPFCGETLVRLDAVGACPKEKP